MSTGLGWVDDKLNALNALPPGSVGRRAGYASLVALGITLTGYGSYIFNTLSQPIPYKLIPDLRGLALLVSGFSLGAYAAYGSARHRSWALVGVLAFVIGFHLEEALVHWFGPYPGSITGTPIGLLGTGGSLLALAGVVLLHVEVESARLSRDLETRGAERAATHAVAAGLRGEGARRVMALALGVAALGLLALVAQKLFGTSGKGGEYILLVGSLILVGLAVLVVRLGRRR